MGINWIKRDTMLVMLIPICIFFSGIQYSFAQDSLIGELKVTKDLKTKAKLLLNLSRKYEEINTSKSIEYAYQAIAISEKIDDDLLKVNSLLALGRTFWSINNFKLASEYGQQALLLCEKLDLIKEKAIAQSILANTYSELGDYDKSSEFNFKNLKIYEEIGDEREIGILLGNIAADFSSQQNYKKALEYMFKSIEIAKKIHDSLGISQQYNNIGTVYSQNYNNYNKALLYYRESLHLNIKLSFPQQQAINLSNIGLAYFKLGFTDSAFYYYQKALPIFMKLENKLALAQCKILLSEYYFNKHEYKNSLENSLDALELGQEYNSFETILEAASMIQKVHLTQGDTVKAFLYNTMRNQAKDSLYFRQNQKTLIKLELQYNFEKRDKEREIKQQRNNYILIFIFICLASGIIIFILINSRQRIKVKNLSLEKEKFEIENQTIKTELEFKNKELSINLLALSKKNDLIRKISLELTKLNKIQSLDETKFELKRILSELQKSTDEKLWKEFSIRFNEAHANFYESLLKKYPNLSQNELKLCAYLRLNMSTKDIAELTGQRGLSIEYARYRLRKKMGISNSDINLVTFLAQI